MLTLRIILSISIVVVGLLLLQHLLIIRRAAGTLKKTGVTRPLRGRGPLYLDLDNPGVPLDIIPAHVILLLLLHEDDRFFVHNGFNFPEIWKALKITITTGKLKGGSSITQQLARSLFLKTRFGSLRQRLSAKFSEVLLTIYLERLLSKRKILELYINRIHFWDRIFGIAHAADYFFNKDATNLTIAEAEYLISLIPGQFLKSERLFWSPWGEQNYDYKLSYEKIIAARRWFNQHTSSDGTNLTYKDVESILNREALQPKAQAAEIEIRLQIAIAKDIEEIAWHLTGVNYRDQLHCGRTTTGVPLLFCRIMSELDTELDNSLTIRLLKTANHNAHAELLSLIKRHHVATLLSDLPYSNKLPDVMRTGITQLQEIESTCFLAMQHGFASLHSLLEGAQIKYLLIKGIDVYTRLYNAPHYRASHDVDILVPERSFETVVSLLSKSSYRFADAIDLKLAKKYALQTGEALSWKDPNGITSLDLHILSDTQFQQHYETSVERAITIENDVLEYRGLSADDLIEYLCAHGRKHLWCRILWLEDVRRLLKEIPLPELKTKVAQDFEAKGNYNLYMPCYMISRILGRFSSPITDIPLWQLQQLGRFYFSIVPHLLSSTSSPPQGLKKIHLLLMFQPNLAGKLCAFMRFVFEPSMKDIQMIQLPLKLFWAYRILRPLFGIYRYATRKRC